jgi:hypothetical protein
LYNAGTSVAGAIRNVLITDKLRLYVW